MNINMVLESLLHMPWIALAFWCLAVLTFCDGQKRCEPDHMKQRAVVSHKLTLQD